MYTIEESEQESFGVVSALLGPEFALRAEESPHLLQKSQRLLVRPLTPVCTSYLVALRASATRSVQHKA